MVYLFMKKSELLLPGGNLKKVKTAFMYGADSVYVGTPDMSLRSKSEFSLDDLKVVSDIAKKNNKKFYFYFVVPTATVGTTALVSTTFCHKVR